MSPLFLPRIVPLPPFDADSAAASTSRPGGCCFDAVADAEEALEAQVTEMKEMKHNLFFRRIDLDTSFFFALPSRALLEAPYFSCFFSR